MSECKSCIHRNVCFHKTNIETKTYAYMGVKFDAKKCKHFISADMVEVRHGYWKNYGAFCVCSVCGESNPRTKPYCPNCGAKMDGERKEQT
jgi:hypothetical protein